jgi:hypothetical protein
MKLEYSYTPEQVRVFPPSQDAIQLVDDFITKLDVWASKKLKELDRSEKE